MKKYLMGAGLLTVAATALSVSAASGRDGTPASSVAPLAEHVRTSAAGYEVTVHPAFSSRITLLGQDGSATELYRQEGTFNLPSGQTAGPEQHVIRLQGGQFDRDIGFVVSDPRHQIAKITVELYGPEHQAGMQGSPVVERVVVSNVAKTCPPYCE